MYNTQLYHTMCNIHARCLGLQLFSHCIALMGRWVDLHQATSTAARIQILLQILIQVLLQILIQILLQILFQILIQIQILRGRWVDLRHAASTAANRLRLQQ